MSKVKALINVIAMFLTECDSLNVCFYVI